MHHVTIRRGLHTVGRILSTPTKALLAIKGISDAKVEKVGSVAALAHAGMLTLCPCRAFASPLTPHRCAVQILEAARKLVPTGFVTGSEALLKAKVRVRR